MNPKAIKDAREASGLTLRDLAKLTGLSASTLQRIENGVREAKYSQIVKLYTALNLEVPEPDLGAMTIEERRLIAAWRDGDYSPILQMIAKKLEDE